MWGLDESKIQLDSTKFTLNEVMSSATPSGSSAGGVNLMDALNQGVRYYNQVNDQKKSLQERVDKATGSEWWLNPAKQLLQGGLATVAPYLGGLVGLVTAFLGGSSSATAREPLNLQGVLQMRGTISTPRQIVAMDFALAIGPSGPDFYRPLQRIPWGVFNLRARPVMHVFAAEEFVTDYGTPIMSRGDYSFTNNPLSYVLNPAAGVTITSTKVAFVYGNAAPSPFDATASGSSGYVQYFCNGSPCYYQQWGDTPASIAVELKLHINSPTRYSDRDLVMYKIFPYDAEWEYSQNY